MAGKADGSVIIDSRFNTSGFQTGMANMKKGFDGLGSALGKLAKVMAGVFAVKQLVQFGKEAIELGSDLSEVQNVVDVTFGNLNEEINDFAKNAITQFGLSETAAKQYTSTMGAMLKSMGFTTREAADMGKTITGLAADMASFYNLNAEDAFYKIRSGISGETEPLKQLGINLNVANLEQYALTQGITKSYNAMTQQEQALLRYNYLLSVTADAQGDFARTSNSWANQTRVLSEQFNALKATIGQGLINVFTPVLKLLNALLARLQTVANAFRAFTELITGNKSQSGSGYEAAADGIGEIAGATEDSADATKKAEKANKKYLSGLDEIRTYAEEEKKSFDGGASAGGIGGGAVDFGTVAEGETVVDKLSDKLLEVKDILTGLFKPFKDAWAAEGQGVIDAASTALSNIGNLAQSVGKSFYDVWTNGTGTTTLSTILEIVQNILTTVGNLAGKFTEAWNTAGIGTSIVQGLSNLLNIILGTIERITGSISAWAGQLDFTPLLTSINSLLLAIQPLAQKIGDGLAWAYENVLLPLGQWTIEEALPATIDLFSAALNTLNEIIEALEPLGNWLWENFLQPIGEWAGNILIDALTAITDLLTKFGDWISEHQTAVENFTIVVGSFVAAWTIVDLASKIYGIIAALASWIVTGGLATAVTTGLSVAIGFLTSPITLAVAIIGSLIAIGILLYKNWDKIKEAAGKLKDWLVEKFTEIKDKVGNIVQSVRDWIVERFTAIKDGVVNIVQLIRDWIVEKFTEIREKITNITNNIQTTLSNIWNGIKNTVSNVFNGIKTTISNAWNAVKTGASTVWNGIKTTLSNIWNGIKNTVSNVFNGIKTTISNVWNTVKTGASTVWTGIKTTLSNIWNGIKNTVSNVFGGIKNTISNAWNTVSNIIGDLKNIFGDVKNKASETVGNIVSFFRNINLPDIPTPHFSVGSRSVTVAGLSFSIPTVDVDWYAKGGLFDQPSLIGVGEAGKEAVLPLENRKTMSTIANSIVANLPKPYLASGAVVPPKAQYSTVNIETSRRQEMDDMYSMMKDVLSRLGQTVGNGEKGGTYTFIGQINRRTLFEEMMTEAQLVRDRTGRNPYEMA